MKAAKRRGRHVGRPPKLTLEQLALARRLIDSDLETRAGAAALLKVGKSTLRRALNAPDRSGGTVAGENVLLLYGPENEFRGRP
jgi:DNA invertase Pin-like site-specific DNA recombinase